MAGGLVNRVILIASRSARATLAKIKHKRAKLAH